MLISGACHCRNICFVLDWTPDPLEIPARACTCSFCVKHGGVWTACPAGSLKVTFKNPTRVSHYAFGTKTAHFHVCVDCGVVPVVTSRIDDRVYAVVSVHALEGIATSLLRHATASFDGEGQDDRLIRRQRNWIGNVAFVDDAV